MNFVSTSNNRLKSTLHEAVCGSIAPDGGLLLPERIPRLPDAFFKNIMDMSLTEIAYVIFTSFLGENLDPAKLKKISEKVFSAPIPLVELDSGIMAMELFHGPTLTVKDFGAEFLVHILRELEPVRNRKIILASSGNSAIAVASAFRNLPDSEIYIVCPRGSIRHRRHMALSSFGKSINILELNSDIDRCNAVVRSFINEERSLGHSNICGANSTNIARLLPEIVFYFHAYAELCRKTSPVYATSAVYSVPCGNFSNAAAALMAKKMNLPMGKIIAAQTPVNALGNFLNASASPLQKNPSAYAQAMNIENPTNLPRIVALCGTHDAISKEIEPFVATDAQIASTINSVRENLSYNLDVHSAIAYCGAKSKQEPIKVALATAHPSVAIDAFTEISGSPIEHPHQLARLTNRELSPIKHIAPTVQGLRKFIRENQT